LTGFFCIASLEAINAASFNIGAFIVIMQVII